MALHAVAAIAEEPTLRRVRAFAGEHVPGAQVFFELVEAQRLHVRHHPGEARRHDFLLEAEGLEGLRADVRAQRADAELREHLHQPGAQRLEQRARRRLLRHGHARREPRRHHVRAGGDHRGAAVRVAGEPVARRYRRLHPQPHRGEALVHGARCEHCRDRQICGAVVQDQVRLPAAHSSLRVVADRGDARAQRRRRAVELDPVRDEPRIVGERVKRVFVKQRGVDRDDGARRGDIAVRIAAADERAHVEDEAFAQGVDRGVRHLREALAQILRHRNAPLEERRRRIVAHRPHRLDAAGQGRDDLLELVRGVAEAHQIAPQRDRIDLARRFGRQVEVP